MEVKHLPWLFVALAWMATTAAIMNTNQGTYEDSNYVRAFQGTPRPPLVVARGVARASLWYQVNHDLSPQNIRAWNVRLAFLVALGLGLLAARLGLCAWAASGLMIVHPMSVETLASMTGRYELVATCGVLLACVGATTTSRWRWPLIASGMAFAIGGKEPALFGLVPVLWLLRRPRLAGLTLIGLLLFAGYHYHAGLISTQVPTVGAWALVQGAAGWRVLSLMFIPHHQTIDFDYDAVPRLWQISACGCLALAAYVAWTCRQTQPIVSGSLAWCLIVIAPRLIVQTPKSYFNEHQAFMMLPAVALLFAWLITTIEGQRCLETA